MKTENQTLQQLLSDRVTVFANGDRPREIIDKAVEAMFVDVIKDAFRSYGDLGKAVQEAIKAAMPANVGDVFELTKYNALIGESLKQRWHQAAVESTLLERATAAIDGITDPDERDRAYLKARSEAVGGATLRDYFAAKAMQGLLAQSCGTALGSDLIHGAQYAYQMADAMLKAREVKS